MKDSRIRSCSLVMFTFLFVSGITAGCMQTQAIDKETDNQERKVKVAYGEMSRKNITDSISDLDRKDIESTGHVVHVEELLKGRVAGVRVTQRPDGSYTVQIRGISSLYGNTEPLWVVDGIPISDGRRDMNWLNPHDVDSITVLKGAAASMYGSRGANGVILVSTKRAR